MKLIVGLGNPAPRYFGTRHNAGRALLEWMAAQSKAEFRLKKKLKSSVASLVLGSQEVILAYPEVYMNVSGEAVLLLVNDLKIDAARDLLVVVDDAAIPFGKFRLRAQGSDGGHNGLKSITASLGASAYPRLRFGIGECPGELPLEAYVLAKFEKEEAKGLEGICQKGFEACLAWANQPIARAMNVVNA